MTEISEEGSVRTQGPPALDQPDDRGSEWAAWQPWHSGSRQRGWRSLPGGGGEGLHLWGGAQLIEAGVRGRNPTTLTEERSPEE